MRGCFFALALCLAAAVSGCSSGSTETTVKQIGEGTTAKPSSAAAEGSGEDGLDPEAFEATVESLEARLAEMERLSESRQAAMEESLREMELSVREASKPATGTERIEPAGTGETAAASYGELLRSSGQYENRTMSYTGRVIQSVGLDSRTLQLLIAVDQDDSKRMVCELDSALLSAVPGQGDIVTVRGIFDGVHRYLMGDGTRAELPSLQVNALTIDSVAETVPESAAETVPDSAAEIISEPAAETVPEPMAESVPDTLPENFQETVSGSAAEENPENAPGTAAEAAPEAAAESAPGTAAEAAPGAALEAAPEAAAETAPEAAAEAAPGSALEAAPGMVPESSAAPPQGGPHRGPAG